VRLPRFRIRTLMVVVALAGVIAGTLVGCARMAARRQRFNALAKAHGSDELVARSLAKMAYDQIDTLAAMRKAEEANGNPPDPWDDVIAQARLQATHSCAFADYHAALKRKYEHAARRPWLPVPPDPPEPE
jgi:hypothetical protein